MLLHSTLPSLLLFRSLLCFLLVGCCYADLANDTIYLTWQRNPETTMTIQWISLVAEESNPDDNQIYYQVKGDEEWQTANGTLFLFPQASQYHIHRVELVNLCPNTTYCFKIKNSEQEYLFRTMPMHLNLPIRFVVGGDMYHDEIELMNETSRQAAKLDPHFALIGGDIAYAVEKPQSPQIIQKWIEWIQAWHATMITKEGRLIPVLAAIGNHDLVGHFDQNPIQAKIFSSLFPMPGEQIYNVLDFGSYLSIFILDSGHANPINGIQAAWLKNALEDRQNIKYRFAIYHVPAYPSVRSYHNRYSALIRRYWVPTFEKGGLTMAFENHDHAYKRTHPLIKNRINSQGIVYVGDGCWGVAEPRTFSFLCKPFYLAKWASTRHFLVITLAEDQQHLVSIDSQGKIIDAYDCAPLLSLREKQEAKTSSKH